MLLAQPLDPALLTKPLGDSWPTYSGDYSGKRYSSLTQINQINVKNLTLAWVTQGHVRSGRRRRRPWRVRLWIRRRRRPPSSAAKARPIPVAGGGTNIRASILEVNGILYLSTPDNAWAVDARDGHELWHYFWKTKGGTHIGNRGLGMWGNWLYMETPDDYLVCLDARTGKERWHKEIANFNQQYFSTMAPVVIGNHILIGTGNDLDEPGYVQSRDPETGDVQWTFYTVPMKKGDPGLETWGSLDGARHGAGNVWIPGAYDPETHFTSVGTGNPSPAYTNPPSRDGDNLYTCSIVAHQRRYRQDGVVLPVESRTTRTIGIPPKRPILVDGEFNGKPRKMVLHADRNGYFFTLDRLTGEHLVTSKFSDAVNWAKGINAKGQPVRDPGQGFHRARLAGVAQQRRRDQLAAAGLLAGYRAVLCAHQRCLRDVLSDRNRSARRHGPRRQGRGWPGLARLLSHGDRLQDRQGRVAAPLSRHRRQSGQRHADHRRQAVVRRRHLRGNLVAYDPGQRQDSLAHAVWARSRTRRRPTCSTATSISWSPPATRCTPSLCTKAKPVSWRLSRWEIPAPASISRGEATWTMPPRPSAAAMASLAMSG